MLSAAQAKQDQITRAELLGDVRGVYSRMSDEAMKRFGRTRGFTAPALKQAEKVNSGCKTTRPLTDHSATLRCAGWRQHCS